MATLPITQTASPFRFLTLDEAALETGYTKDNLLKRAKEGRILAGMFDGTLRVAVTENGELVEIAPLPQNGNEDDINARLRQIRREDFAHLEGVKITVSEAEQRYGINRRTIIAWKQRGYIKTLKTGYRMELNEADVAYCATIYKVRKPYGSRAPLLDSEGKPYLLKYPDLARQRRKPQVT